MYDIDKHANKFKTRLIENTIIEQDTELHNFVIIYGSELIIRKFKSLRDGITFCQNNLDQSNEIIIRKITNIVKSWRK